MTPLLHFDTIEITKQTHYHVMKRDKMEAADVHF